MANYSVSKEQAERGKYPDVHGLPSKEAREIMDIYQKTSAANTMKSLEELTAYPSQPSGPMSPWSIPIILVVIVLPLWFFGWREQAKKPKPVSELNPGYYDMVDDPAAGKGKINVVDGVYLFPEAKAGAFGSLRHPICQDSIAWLMKQADIETASRSKFRGYTFVLLKNIPARWIKMENGKKPVTQAWVMENELHNFSAWDISAYKKAQLENF